MKWYRRRRKGIFADRRLDGIRTLCAALCDTLRHDDHVHQAVTPQQTVQTYSLFAGGPAFEAKQHSFTH